MKTGAIISRSQSLRILMNDLRKAALETRAAELEAASAQTRQRILNEIERDIQSELRRRRTPYHGHVLY